MAAKETTSKCPHCKGTTESGTHNGCANCGKVKHNQGGKIIK